MERIESTSFVLVISEYGKVVRQYNDKDYDRFMKVSRSMIDDHVAHSVNQNRGEVKNATFHIYTY